MYSDWFVDQPISFYRHPCGFHRDDYDWSTTVLEDLWKDYMSFDPQKLFISLMDFFSILLPGALLTYLLMGEVGPVLLGERYAKFAGTEAWAAFLFASYLFGHLVFLLGSWLDEFTAGPRAPHSTFTLFTAESVTGWPSIAIERSRLKCRR
jgi:hypothetical protein